MHIRSYIDGHQEHPHYISDNEFKKLKKSLKKTDKNNELIKILRNLSDPTKLYIYFLLHKVNEIPVTDISGILGVRQSTISHALADLKNLGLVDCGRCGQLICYRLKRQSKYRNMLSRFEKIFV